MNTLPYRSRPAAAALAFLAALPLSVQATDFTWTPSSDGTWDTTTANWTDGVTNPTTWVNGSGNTASFPAFGAFTNITLGTNIVTGTLSTNGGGTVGIQVGAGSTLDVTNISTAGTSGSAGSIDMFATLTGDHDLNYNSTGGAGSQGRLNLKTAATYTGNTNLTGRAYLLLDGASNALPTGTTVNMTSLTTLRINKSNLTQQIAGLSGSGTFQVSSTGNTVTINTKSDATTSYAGSLTGSTNLTISGDGTQALTGSNVSFTGATQVSGGTLSLGSNLSGTSAVTVNGGLLTSTVANVNLGAGAVTISSGTISPRGTSTGTYTLAANQNLVATGGIFDFNVGTGLDQILGSGTGTFSISGATIALTLGAGFDYDTTYQLFSGFSSGSVSSVAITGYDTTNYLADLSSGGVLSFSTAAIPEPSTVSLLAGAAVLGLVAGRRRRC